ncbi:DNA polymerase subunit Cdc27 [Venturia nashicola]|uniref:DNA polymerase delta subunit 3 n=1 Tax=Venturia nashicola TaxID=86259 RepID=A0A4Z1PK08_9PEZI|nr:DNA polymerase subunit Cdc27 [Venturia nashicola]
MDQYKKWLALNVLNEDRIINYRQLSRALKVHTHLAKQMLYDFHHNQNAKKPQSVHATYLITGTARTGPPPPSTNGTLGDSFLQSSPFPSSIPEPDTDFEIDPDENPVKEDVSTITILLVQEEQLEEAKDGFEEIHSIFVYSLEPGPIKDTQQLTTCNRDIVTQFPSEDPLESYKKYGIPHNPNVKRRTNKRPLPPAEPPVVKAAPKPATKSAPPGKEPAPPTAKLSRSTSDQNKSQKTATVSKTSTPSLPRGKSDLFKSFAKTKPPKAKALAHGTTTPMSEDEADDEDIVMEETEEQKEKAEASRKARREQEEALKRMMESDEDEPMADAPAVEEAVEEGSPIDEIPKDEEKKESVTVQSGRRRGRRRVIKKRTMKDDEGYLVTKEEAVWESFSEEEPEPKKKKTNFTAPTTAKGKKAGGKPGQGNITSFFGKK